MKTTRTYYNCDRCGEDMKAPEELIFEGSYRVQARITCNENYKRVGEIADLCNSCFREMIISAGEYFERLENGKEK